MRKIFLILLSNYRLEGIENGRLVVRRYQEKKEEYGTVKFENDTILFIANG